MQLSEIGILFLSGCGAGLSGALLGLGGGIIIVPILTIMLNFSISQAVGISLMSVLGSSCIVMKEKIIEERIPFLLASQLEIIAVLTALLGASMSLYIDPVFVKFVFSIFAISVGFLMFRRSIFVNKRGCSDEKKILAEIDTVTESTSHNNFPYLLISSGFAGFLSGLLGVGGGIILVPSLTLLGGFSMKVATSTSSYMMAWSGWGGAILFFILGKIDLNSTAAVAIGLFVGTKLGVQYFGKLSSRALSVLFSFVLFYFGVKMWIH